MDVFNFSGGRCRTYRQHPPGTHHRHLQLRWWPLLEIPTAPPGGPPLMSSTLVVAATGHATSTPRGSAINVFNFGGGRCRTCRQHPPGGPHRRLQLQWWPLPDMSPSTTQGASHRCLGNLVLSPRKLSGGIYEGGHRGKHYHYKQGSLMEK
jgi:hypothetical protein